MVGSAFRQLKFSRQSEWAPAAVVPSKKLKKNWQLLSLCGRSCCAKTCACLRMCITPQALDCLRKGSPFISIHGLHWILGYRGLVDGVHVILQMLASTNKPIMQAGRQEGVFGKSKSGHMVVGYFTSLRQPRHWTRSRLRLIGKQLS